MDITPEQYRAALKVVRDYRDQLRGQLDKVVIEVREAEGKNNIQKNSTIHELWLNKLCSLRLCNVIYHNKEALGIKTTTSADTKVEDLEGVSALKLLGCR